MALRVFSSVRSASDELTSFVEDVLSTYVSNLQYFV
jgi:hypothetical protein